MFAGKTTALLARLADAGRRGRRVVALKPAGDTRSGPRLAAHTGASLPAIEVESAEQIASAAAGADIVGIDEVHFFDAGVAAVCGDLRAAGCAVVAAGVDLDQAGRCFGAVAALLAIADEVVRLSAVCARCGAEAGYTQRLIADGARIVVGGAEAYEPRCAGCFEPAPARDTDL